MSAVDVIAFGMVILAAGLVGIFVSKLMAAAMAAAAFVLLCATTPVAAVAIMMAAVPFNNDLGGLPFKIAAADLCAVILGPILLVVRGVSVIQNPLLIPTILYLGFCVVSSASVGFSSEAINSLIQMIFYTLYVPVLIATCISHSEILVGLRALIVGNLTLALVVGMAGTGYVLGLHKNASGASLSFACLVALEMYLGGQNRGFRIRVVLVALACLCLGLLVTLSRGAWLGFLCGAVCILALRQQLQKGFRVALLLVPLLALVWFSFPDDQQAYAINFDASSARNIKARWDNATFALERFQESPLIGAGLGLRKQFDATNIALAILAETGVVGLLLFIMVFVCFFHVVIQTARYLPRSDPYFSLLCIGAALMVCRLAHGSTDHYWGRGMLPVWAGAGLVLAAYNHTRRISAVGSTCTSSTSGASKFGPIGQRSNQE